MVTRPKSPPAVDPASARERLLDAATQLFAAHGYEAISVRSIVERAGTNLNGINYYFGGKRGLYQAVMAREGERARAFTAGLPRAATTDTIERRLESVALRLLTFFVASHTSLPRLAALEIVSPSPDFDPEELSLHDAERDELRAIVADVLGRDAGADLLDQAVRSVLSQCVYFMFMEPALRRAGAAVVTDAAAVRALAAHVARFSLGGLRALASSPA
jgi:AcrR family transcriptional regulator